MKRKCGERLRVTREALGFEHAKDLADALGYEHARYRNWERGDHFPPPEFLIALKRTYGIPADWLLDGEMAMLPKELAAKILKLLKQPRDDTA